MKRVGPYSMAEVAKTAVMQHEQRLKRAFPNIISISDAVQDLDQEDTHVVAIYLNDANSRGIPDKLDAMMPNGKMQSVATEIIKGGGIAKIHLAQGDSISDINSPQYYGSICCGVRSLHNPDFAGIVTSAHVYTKGLYNEDDNTVLPTPRRTALFNEVAQGTWFYKQLTESQDLIVIQLNDAGSLNDPQLKRFGNKCYAVTDADVKSKVTVLARHDKRTDAYIVDHGVGYPVKYKDDTYYKTGIILIGNVPERKDSKPVSIPGDSGSCVFIHKDGVDQLIGILLGSDDNFTFVLPVAETLSSSFEII